MISDRYFDLLSGKGYAMATIIPEGENIQNAIRWVSVNLDQQSDQPLKALIEQAVFKFDLSPVDAEFLGGFFRDRKVYP